MQDDPEAAPNTPESKREPKGVIYFLINGKGGAQSRNRTSDTRIFNLCVDNFLATEFCLILT